MKQSEDINRVRHDRDGCLFTATVHRRAMAHSKELAGSQKSSGETPEK